MSTRVEPAREGVDTYVYLSEVRAPTEGLAGRVAKEISAGLSRVTLESKVLDETFDALQEAIARDPTDSSESEYPGTEDADATASIQIFAPTTLLVASPMPAAGQTISHNWECTVEAVREHTFSATLRSLRDSNATEKIAEIPVEDVTPDDLELLAEGAVFYWAIGYETSPRGVRRRFSQIKFRRLPAWNRRDLERVRTAAEELYERFGDPGTGANDKAIGG